MVVSFIGNDQQLFVGGSCLINDMCVWPPTHVVLCFCFVCLCLVYPMLPVSLDCSFMIAPLGIRYRLFTHTAMTSERTTTSQHVW